MSLRVVGMNGLAHLQMLSAIESSSSWLPLTTDWHLPK